MAQTLGPIDAHQHFWKYEPVEFSWIDDSMRVIRKDFLPEHLAAEIRRAGMAGVVSVQARQTLDETEWLLALAAANDFILGVVGWAPLADPKLTQVLERLVSNPKLRAVRHIIQAEPDEHFILREDFNAGVSALRRFGLAYDILVFERHLPQAIRFVDRHPSQIFVLDHIAKPRIREGAVSPWRENMRELAKRDHVYCKLSGVVTEAGHTNWTEAQLQPYFDAALDAFGPRRLMFGSDWPVCLVATSYGAWLELVRRQLARLSPAERDRVLRGNAIEAYGLRL